MVCSSNCRPSDRLVGKVVTWPAFLAGNRSKVIQIMLVGSVDLAISFCMISNPRGVHSKLFPGAGTYITCVRELSGFPDL